MQRGLARNVKHDLFVHSLAFGRTGVYVGPVHPKLHIEADPSGFHHSLQEGHCRFVVDLVEQEVSSPLKVSP